MILSEKHRFVFVKGVKVASTSIEMALAPVCGPQDIVTPITPIDELTRLRAGGACRNFAEDPAFERGYMERLRSATPETIGSVPLPKLAYYNHMSLTEVAHRFRKPLTDFRIVYAVRSPYSRVISWINMRLSYAGYVRGGEMRGDPVAFQRELDRTLTNRMILTIRNIDRYRWRDGSLPAPTIRYESLQSDFAAVATTLGINPAPELPHAKRGVMADALQPGEIFRRDQIESINRIFDDEFAAFGYPMLSPAAG
jgi:hypothetical protein